MCPRANEYVVAYLKLQLSVCVTLTAYTSHANSYAGVSAIFRLSASVDFVGEANLAFTFFFRLGP